MQSKVEERELLAAYLGFPAQEAKQYKQENHRFNPNSPSIFPDPDKLKIQRRSLMTHHPILTTPLVYISYKLSFSATFPSLHSSFSLSEKNA